MRESVEPLCFSPWSPSRAARRRRAAGGRGARAVTPADFVASIVDVAAGRNAALAETGLVLKRIEFRLAVGDRDQGRRKDRGPDLDAETSRASEASILQQLALEIPASGGKRAAAPAAGAGAREFVDAAMNTARDLARAVSAAGLPQQLNVRRADREDHPLAQVGRRHHRDRFPVWVKPSSART